jgi:putative transposase
MTAPHSPWQSPYVERLIGSIRRECLNHVIAFNETHLPRVLKSYIEYYHRSRIYLSLAKDAPMPRTKQGPAGQPAKWAFLEIGPGTVFSD